jgi:cytochrome c553
LKRADVAIFIKVELIRVNRYFRTAGRCLSQPSIIGMPRGSARGGKAADQDSPDVPFFQTNGDIQSHRVTTKCRKQSCWGNGQFIIVGHAFPNFCGCGCGRFRYHAFGAIARPSQTTASAGSATAASAQPKSTVVQQYCVGCHSDKGQSRRLSLASYDPAHADQQAEVTERMIRKLRAGMMPPPGRAIPNRPSSMVSSLRWKTPSIQRAALHPNPGRRAFQR